MDNSVAAQNPALKITGVKNLIGPNGEDAVTEITKTAFLAQTPETYTHDADGNLAADARWHYTWDGENRLIAVTDSATSTTHFAACDGNGNVASLTKAADGTLTAKYDYNAFGETISSEGPYASDNPFRFSSKFTDNETGHLYYGYRCYAPETGRWLNRDPIMERGGIALYAFCANNGVEWVDTLGEARWNVPTYSEERAKGLDVGPFRSPTAGTVAIPIQCKWERTAVPDEFYNPVDFCLRRRICVYSCYRILEFREKPSYTPPIPKPEMENPLDRYEPAPAYELGSVTGLDLRTKVTMNKRAFLIKTIRVMSNAKKGCDKVVVYETGLMETPIFDAVLGGSGGGPRG